MSMEIINVLQAAALFIIYTFLVVCIPAILFYHKFADRRVHERFMIYMTIGNFYIMNIVYILQLLHISSVFTLVLFTVVPIAGYYIRQHYAALKNSLLKSLDTFNRFSEGVVGKRTFMSRCFCTAGGWFRGLWNHLYSIVRRHKTEYVLLLILCIFVCVIYGTNSIVNYGYTVSDLPVHNYWINEMGKNNIFAAGVYPFGFHCIVYYIHTVFGFDTYVILRLFTVTQALYIHLVLYAFVRGICRSSFAAYAGVFLFFVTDMYNQYCIIRYISALPQEFGMIFILPSIYFIFEFFRHHKISKAEPTKQHKQEVLTDCIIAAMCFSMTIAVHFYDTMIAGLFCVAIVIGFIARFFRPGYFVRIMGAFMLAMLLGILPMAAAVVSGKPLQGSLGWGMNIITGGKSSGTQSTPSDNNEQNTPSDNNTQDMPSGSDTQDLTSPSGADEGDTAVSDDEKEEITMQQENLQQDIEEDIVISKAEQVVMKTQNLLVHIYTTLCKNIQISVFAGNGPLFTIVTLACCGLLLAAGILMCILHQYDYGFREISISIFILLMLGLFNAKDIGLPQLMDQNRSRIYLVYMLGILYSMTVDFVCSVFLVILHRPKLVNGMSLVLTAAVCAAGVYLFGIRNCVLIQRSNALETNGAIECLYNIMKTHEDNTWTIISANDELQMIDGHGYHYETITFLRYQKSATAQQRLTIPTKYVYFYVEKVPLNYLVAYPRSGQRISIKGAAMQLPSSGGIAPYKGQNRWIVMSKMYYWARRFQKLFPQDMSVYYEDDEFICYRLIQNTSNLYSLVIDFGYNQ